MNRIITVEPHLGEPVYPIEYSGGDEYVVRVEPSELGRVMVDALISAVARRSFDEEGEPRRDERAAKVMMELAFIDGGAEQVVLARPGAVALRGALVEFTELYGENRGDGLTPEDFLAVVEQLPAE